MDEQMSEQAPPRPEDTILWKRTLVVPLIVVGMLVLLSVWSWGGGRTAVRFVLQDDSYSFYLDGRLITTESFASFPGGGIGYCQYRKTVPILPGVQTLRSIVITDNATGQEIFRRHYERLGADAASSGEIPPGWFVNGQGLTAGEIENRFFLKGDWNNVTVDLTIDNLIGGQFFFRVQDQANYAGCFFRPFRDFDSRFYLMKESRKVSQTDNKTIVLDPMETIKRTMNLFLRQIPAVLLVGVILIIGGLVLMRVLLSSVTAKNDSAGESIVEGGNRFFDRFTRGRFWSLLAVLLALLAFRWFLFVTDECLERIPHVQDSAAMLFQAKIFASGHVSVPIPQGKDHFNLTGFFHFRNGRMFSQYPPGHPLFLALGILLGRAWVMPALAASLLLWVVYLIGRHLLSPPWGFLGSLLVFCSPFFQMTAPNFMSHITASLYLAVSFLCLLKLRQSASNFVIPIGGGVALGFLLNTRPMTALAIGAVYGTYLVVVFFASGAKMDLFLRIFRFGVAFAILAVLFLAYNWILMGEPLAFTYGETARKVTGQTYSHFRLAKAFLDNFTLTALFCMVITGWTMPMTTLYLLGTIFPERRSRRPAIVLAAMVGAVFAAYMFYSLSSVTVMYGPRYVAELIFPVILLIVFGGVTLARSTVAIATSLFRGFLRGDERRAEFDRSGISRFTRRLMSGLVYSHLGALGILAFILWVMPGYPRWPGNTYVPQNVSELRGFNHISPRMQRLVAEQGITNAVVFVGTDPNYSTQWWHYGSVFFENTPLFDGPVIYAKDLGDQLNRDLMLNYPGRNYYLGHYERNQLRLVADAAELQRARDALKAESGDSDE